MTALTPVSDVVTSAPFCFLSELLGKKVYGKSGAYLGKVDDLVVTIVEGNPYPRVDTMILLNRRKRASVPTDVPSLVSLSKGRRLDLHDVEGAPVVIKDNQLLLRDTLYDKQIVDVNGAKVERVNDVYILVQAGRPYVVHVDVGFTGLARRLGFERAVRSIAGTFGRKLHDELISWKFVQPFPGRVQTVRVMLRASEMKGLHPADLAEILEELDRDERVSLIRTLGPRTPPTRSRRRTSSSRRPSSETCTPTSPPTSSRRWIRRPPPTSSRSFPSRRRRRSWSRWRPTIARRSRS